MDFQRYKSLYVNMYSFPNLTLKYVVKIIILNNQSRNYLYYELLINKYLIEYFFGIRK